MIYVLRWDGVTLPPNTQNMVLFVFFAFEHAKSKASRR